MKFFLIMFTLALLVPHKSYSQDAGLFHLSPFQEKTNVIDFGYDWYDNEITFSEMTFGKEEIHETEHALAIEYSRKIAFQWVVSSGIRFHHAKTFNPRSLAEGNATFYSTGFSEPYFKVHTRRYFPTANDNLVDLYAIYQPSLFNRVVGNGTQNFYTGRHLFTLGILYGAEEAFTDWEFQMGLETVYHSHGEEEDSNLGTKRQLEDYLDTSAHFAAWYFLSESWSLKGLFKFTVHGNIRGETRTESTTFQRGTSLTKGLALKHQRGDYIYSIAFENVNNDYYLKRTSGNLEGDAVSNSVFYSVTKNY